MNDIMGSTTIDLLAPSLCNEQLLKLKFNRIWWNASTETQLFLIT